jgi:hypothetical protein
MIGSLGTTGARLTKGWFTDLQVTNAIAGSVTGNAATVTTNADLTGPIISSGNTTSVASQTGTGSTFVMDTSPTLITPNIGTATGSISGNAGTATALQTARTINGISFDGTANITITAAASTLTGTTLASNIVSSSLTSVGTLGSLALSGAVTGATGYNGLVVTANTGVITGGTWNGTTVAVANGGTGATSLNNLITLATHTTGNYIATIAGSSQISVSGSGSENAAASLSILADSIGDSQLTFDTGQALTTASSPTFAGVTLTGILNCSGTTNSLGTNGSGVVSCHSLLSDRRLKKDITPVNISMGLSLINALAPVEYNWIDPDVYGGTTQRQYGFIAQEAMIVAPDLVGTTTPTALTPDHTYFFNYIGLIAPIVKAIQELSTKVSDTAHLVIEKLTVHDRFCINDTCITEDDLKQLIAQKNNQAVAASDTSNESLASVDTKETVSSGTAPAVVESLPTSVDIVPSLELNPQ